MSLLFHLSFVTFCCLVCHVASMVLLNFIFPWLEVKEIENVSCKTKFFGFLYTGLQECSTLRDNTYEPSRTYRRFIVVNFIVVCIAGWIYSLCAIEDIERRVLNFLQLAVDLKGIELTEKLNVLFHTSI